ncbi:MAG: phage baseplate protein [Bilophila wadsworthia]
MQGGHQGRVVGEHLRPAGLGPVQRHLYNALLALQNAREPFDIVTGKRKYGNMLLEKLTVTTTLTPSTRSW